MFLPILNYTDGYGLTYGARASFVDWAGPRSRASLPFTWGGTKRAAVELEKSWPTGRVERVFGGGSLSRQENPHYRVNDDRREVWIGVSRHLAPHLSVEGRLSLAGVRFGSIDDRLLTSGVQVAFDTRIDPGFPRNAVFATAGWDRLDPRDGPAVNRLRADVRGYLGLTRQSVLAVRAQYAAADNTLPLYERHLAGGADTLRGYRAGTFSGDNLAALSAEVRVPLGSALRISRVGIALFADSAAAYDHGTALGDARFRFGGGAGVFLVASVFHVRLDLGVRERGGTRVHLMSGVQF